MAYGMLRKPSDENNPLTVFHRDLEKIREAILKGDTVVSTSFFTNGLVNKEEGSLKIGASAKLYVSSIASGLFYDGVYFSSRKVVVPSSDAGAEENVADEEYEEHLVEVPSEVGDYFVYAKIATEIEEITFPADLRTPDHEYDKEALSISFKGIESLEYGVRLGKISVSALGVISIIDTIRDQAYLKDEYVQSITHLLNPDQFELENGKVVLKLLEDYRVAIGLLSLSSDKHSIEIAGRFHDDDGYYNNIGIDSDRVRFPGGSVSIDSSIGYGANNVRVGNGRLSDIPLGDFYNKKALVFAYRDFGSSGEELLGYGLYPQPRYRITGVVDIAGQGVEIKLDGKVAYMNEFASFLIVNESTGARELVVGYRRDISSDSIFVNSVSGNYSDLPSNEAFLIQLDKFKLYDDSGAELFGGQYRFLEFCAEVDVSGNFTDLLYSTYPFEHALKKPELLPRFHDFINYMYDKLMNDMCPIGSIIGWHKHLHGNNDPLSLPPGWVECNGQSHTLGNGTTITAPDLNDNKNSWNSKGSFLRGDGTSGVMENDALQNHKHIDSGHLHEIRTTTTTGGLNSPQYSYEEGNLNAAHDYHVLTRTARANLGGATIYSYYGTPRVSKETRPVNMSVVWIMRVE